MSNQVPKKRKVFYDEYSDGFFFESRIEALERLCRQKDRQVAILNRSQKLVLDNTNKRTDAARDFFDMKISTDIDSARSSLKDKVAHKRALHFIGHVNDLHRLPDKENYGRYGFEAAKTDIMNLIDIEKSRLTSTYVRKTEAARLLQMRKQMLVMDRTKDTNTLLGEWRKSGASVKSQPEVEEWKSSGKGLILPPITVQKATTQQSLGEANLLKKVQPQEGPQSSSFNTVFITCAANEEDVF